MATATVTEFITQTVNATAATSSATSDVRATPQGGVFEDVNPTHWDPSNPIVLFIIQASIVIILTRIIHFPLTYIRQPRVIAEVLTGIILGPSIMGRIPGFTAAIFPTASLPSFNLAANLGLILFLFLVGLEVDLRYLLSNWRIALSVGALGMAIPFGLGAAIAWGLYHQFREDENIAHIDFGIYLLFIGIAMAITVSCLAQNGPFANTSRPFPYYVAFSLPWNCSPRRLVLLSCPLVSATTLLAGSCSLFASLWSTRVQVLQLFGFYWYLSATVCSSPLLSGQLSCGSYAGVAAFPMAQLRQSSRLRFCWSWHLRSSRPSLVSTPSLEPS